MHSLVLGTVTVLGLDLSTYFCFLGSFFIALFFKSTYSELQRPQ